MLESVVNGNVGDCLNENAEQNAVDDADLTLMLILVT